MSSCVYIVQTEDFVLCFLAFLPSSLSTNSTRSHTVSMVLHHLYSEKVTKMILKEYKNNFQELSKPYEKFRSDTDVQHKSAVSSEPVQYVFPFEIKIHERLYIH